MSGACSFHTSPSRTLSIRTSSIRDRSGFSARDRDNSACPAYGAPSERRGRQAWLTASAGKSIPGQYLTLGQRRQAHELSPDSARNAFLHKLFSDFCRYYIRLEIVNLFRQCTIGIQLHIARILFKTRYGRATYEIG